MLMSFLHNNLRAHHIALTRLMILIRQFNISSSLFTKLKLVQSSQCSQCDLSSSEVGKFHLFCIISSANFMQRLCDVKRKMKINFNFTLRNCKWHGKRRWWRSASNNRKIASAKVHSLAGIVDEVNYSN